MATPASKIGNRIGFGIGIDDGPALISELREILGLMEGIRDAAKSVPGTIRTAQNGGSGRGGASDRFGQLIQDRERAEREGARNVERIGTSLEKALTKTAKDEQAARLAGAKATFDALEKAHLEHLRNVGQHEKAARLEQDKAERAAEKARADRAARLQGYAFQAPRPGSTEEKIFQAHPDLYRRSQEALYLERSEKQPRGESTIDPRSARIAARVLAENEDLVTRIQHAETYRARTGGELYAAERARAAAAAPPPIVKTKAQLENERIAREADELTARGVGPARGRGDFDYEANRNVSIQSLSRRYAAEEAGLPPTALRPARPLTAAELAALTSRGGLLPLEFLPGAGAGPLAGSASSLAAQRAQAARDVRGLPVQGPQINAEFERGRAAAQAEANRQVPVLRGEQRSRTDNPNARADAYLREASARQEARFAELNAENERAAAALRAGKPRRTEEDIGEGGPVVLGRKGRKTRDEAADASKQIDALAGRATTLQNKFSGLTIKKYGAEIAEQGQTANRAINETVKHLGELQAELGLPKTRRRPFKEIQEDIRGAEKELKELTREFNHAKSEGLVNGPPAGSGGLGGPGGPGGPGRGGPGGPGRGSDSVYAQGLFGFGGRGGLGSITASILTRDLIRGSIRDFNLLIRTSLQAADAQSLAEVQLNAAARRSGELAQSTLQVAENIRTQLHLSRTNADLLVASSTRLASQGGLSTQSGQIARVIGDIGASRGIKPEQLGDLVSQAGNEQGRFAEEYLGQRIETVYKKYARDNYTELVKGTINYKASVRDLVGQLTDYEKKQAVINALLEKQGEFAGAAAARQQSVAGQIEASRAKLDDLTAALGRFLTTNKVLVQILDAGLGLVNAASRTQGSGVGPGVAAALDGDQIRANYLGSGENRFNQAIRKGTTALLPGAIGLGAVGAAHAVGGTAAVTGLAGAIGGGSVVATVGAVAAGTAAVVALGFAIKGMSDAAAEGRSATSGAKEGVRGLWDTLKFTFGSGRAEVEAGQAVDTEFARQNAAKLEASRQGRAFFLDRRTGQRIYTNTLNAQNQLDHSETVPLAGGRPQVTPFGLGQTTLGQGLSGLGIQAPGGGTQPRYSEVQFENDQEYQARKDRANKYINSQNKQLARQEEEFVKAQNDRAAALGRVREFQANLPDFQGQQAALVAPGNEFVKTLSDLATVQERIIRQYPELSDGAREFLTQQQQEALNLTLAFQRTDAQLAAQRGLSQAKSLQAQANIGLLAQEERLLAVTRSRAQAAVENVELSNKSRYLQTGYAPFARQNRDQLFALDSIFGGFGVGQNGNYGRAAQEAIDQQRESILGRASLDQLADDPYLRRTAIGVFDRRRAQNDFRTRQAIEQADLGERIATDAQAQLAEIERGREAAIGAGVRPEQAGQEARRRFLATYSALGERELTPELRAGYVQQLQAQAVADTDKDKQAEAANKAAQETRANIFKELVALRKGLTDVKGNAQLAQELTIRVLNDSQARTDQRSLQEAQAGFDTTRDAREAEIARVLRTQFGFGAGASGLVNR